MPSDALRCEPPEEYRYFPWHWLRHPRGHLMPWQWIAKGWRVTDGAPHRRPAALWRHGYRYYAPAIPPEPKGETDAR